MKELRRVNESLTVNGMTQSTQDNFSKRLDDYINDLGPTTAPSLERLRRRFAYIHRFGKRAEKGQSTVISSAKRGSGIINSCTCQCD